MEFVQQEDDFTCGVACVAMVAGMSFWRARRRWKHPITSGLSAWHLNQLLRNCKVRFRRNSLPRLRTTNAYIVTVASLNIVGGLHHVVMFFDGRWNVLDPQRGRKGKRFYAKHRDDSSGVQLLSWADPVEILSVN